MSDSTVECIILCAVLPALVGLIIFASNSCERQRKLSAAECFERTQREECFK